MARCVTCFFCPPPPPPILPHRYKKRLYWAVGMVQRAYRGHQVRQAIRRLVQSIFVKKWDRKKKQFYFLDTRNGNIRWIKPHGAGSAGISLKVMCVECNLNPATRMCVECEDPYWYVICCRNFMGLYGCGGGCASTAVDGALGPPTVACCCCYCCCCC